MAIGESESQTSGDFSSSVFSMAFARSHNSYPPGSGDRRWSSLSNRNTFWTKYCLLCVLCGASATILAGIFLIVAALFRYHTTSIYYFETVPTYVPAILLSICGVSTMAFSCKRNRNIILLRITAFWSLVSAALSSVITITTSLIHMNRLQTLKECVYTRNPPSCTCFGQVYGIEGLNTGVEPLHFVFENTTDCDVIHGVLYSCLRAVFAISVVAVLLSIFLCMLLYQLIGHERKKAYWTRIRRINSDWSSDFLTCLSRPLPNDRSLLPLMTSTSRSLTFGLPASSSLMSMGAPHQGVQWGPPPPYEQSTSADLTRNDEPTRRSSILCNPTRTVTQHVAPVTSRQNTGIQFHPAETQGLSRGQHPFSTTITTIVQQERPSSSYAQSEAWNHSVTTVVPRLPLRESKISITSVTSDTPYSQDEELFQEKQIKIQSESIISTWDSGMASNFKNRNTSLPSSPILTNFKRILRRRSSGVAAMEGMKDTSGSRSLPGTPLRILRTRMAEVELLESYNDLC